MGNIIDDLVIYLRSKADTRGFKKVDGSMKKTRKGASLLRKTLAGVGAFMAIKSGGDILQNYIDFEVSLGAIEARFEAVSSSSREARRDMEFMNDIVSDLGLNWKASAESFSIFYASTKKILGSNISKQVFEDWSRVSRVLHMTPDNMERVFYALREMSSKGAIYMQDLARQIGSAVPNAMFLASDAMGYTDNRGATEAVQAFKADAQAGKIDANEFIEKFSRRMRLEYGSNKQVEMAMGKPDALLGRINYAFVKFATKISESGGNEGLSSILQKVLNIAEGLEAGAPVVGKGIKYIGVCLDKIFILVGAILSAMLLNKMRIASMRGIEGGIKNMKMFSSRYPKMGTFGKITTFFSGAFRTATTTIGSLASTVMSLNPWVVGISGTLILIWGILSYLQAKKKDELKKMGEAYSERSRLIQYAAQSVGKTGGMTREKFTELFGNYANDKESPVWRRAWNNKGLDIKKMESNPTIHVNIFGVQEPKDIVKHVKKAVKEGTEEGVTNFGKNMAKASTEGA